MSIEHDGQCKTDDFTDEEDNDDDGNDDIIEIF